MKTIIIFTYHLRGHHIEYLHHLNEQAVKERENRFVFVVPEEFKWRKDCLIWTSANNVIYDYLSQDECEKCSSIRHPHFIHVETLWRKYQCTRTIVKFVVKYHADEVFLISLCIALPFIGQVLPDYCKISGIVYSFYPHYNYKGLKLLREKTDFRVMSNTNHFKSVYILNSEKLTAQFNKVFKTKTFKYLTDPITAKPTDGHNLRNKLAIPMDVKLYIHFGALDFGKGTLDILQSVALLTEEQKKKYYFVFAGQISELIRADFYSLYNELKSSVHILLYDRFCEFDFIYSLCKSCDAILMPYHTSGQSSGVVGYGAMYRKPLLATKGGLVGDLVEKYRLGITIKDHDAASIAKALDEVENYKYDADEEYVKPHTVDEFCNTIFNGF